MAESTPPRNQPGSTTHEIKQRATDQFERMADNATEQFRNVAEQAEQLANRATEQGRVARARVEQVTGNFQRALDKSVKEQPMATLAMAAAVGFVLGALWKS